MSTENVEVVRRAFAAYAEGGIEDLVLLHSEDLVIYSIPEWPDDAEYHGRAGLRKLSQQWTNNFDEFGFEVQEVHDAGGDIVVALSTMTARIKGSAVPISQEIGSVTKVRDGQLCQIRYFSSWPGALEAAGLSG
jgi:ketosteroid isomerase-like protein